MTLTWKEHWEQQRTPWDAGATAPSLVDLVASGTLPTGRALVPGAGSGYDVLTLAAPDRTAIGLELSPIAVQRFEERRAEAEVSADVAQMLVADFFEWEPEQKFDVIWDYTFLCAIPLNRREEWARRVDELLAPEGELVMLIFPNRPIHDDPERPPFVLTPDAVRELLTPRFEPVHLAPAERSHPGRGGNEWLGRFRRAL